MSVVGVFPNTGTKPSLSPPNGPDVTPVEIAVSKLKTGHTWAKMRNKVVGCTDRNVGWGVIELRCPPPAPLPTLPPCSL